jgi:hypothetical protein
MLPVLRVLKVVSTPKNARVKLAFFHVRRPEGGVVGPFAEKLRDVVGLYVDPPAHAVGTHDRADM